MELSEADFKELFPRKLGTVKKLLRVQKTVCTYTYVCMHICMYVRICYNCISVCTYVLSLKNKILQYYVSWQFRLLYTHKLHSKLSQ